MSDLSNHASIDDLEFLSNDEPAHNDNHSNLKKQLSSEILERPPAMRPTHSASRELQITLLKQVANDIKEKILLLKSDLNPTAKISSLSKSQKELMEDQLSHYLEELRHLRNSYQMFNAKLVEQKRAKDEESQKKREELKQLDNEFMAKSAELSRKQAAAKKKKWGFLSAFRKKVA